MTLSSTDSTSGSRRGPVELGVGQLRVSTSPERWVIAFGLDYADVVLG